MLTITWCNQIVRQLRLVQPERRGNLAHVDRLDLRILAVAAGESLGRKALDTRVRHDLVPLLRAVAHIEAEGTQLADQIFAAETRPRGIQIVQHGPDVIGRATHLTPLMVSQCDIVKKRSSVATEYLRVSLPRFQRGVCGRRSSGAGLGRRGGRRDAGASTRAPTPEHGSQRR
jgi:hypothetical protein